MASFNQLERFSYLFQRSIVMLHLNLFMALTPVVNVIKLFLKEIQKFRNSVFVMTSEPVKRYYFQAKLFCKTVNCFLNGLILAVST